ncbi:MAG: autotransporter-associated beta strand repeat-containing protein [Verrucomicrobia bacterium]|nr:autotransporter-associated beta strand repeat-containing protein [Verrucomicrobiota bacterium]
MGDSAVASGTYVTWPTSTWISLAGGSWPDTNNWLSGFVGGGGSGVTADFSTLTLVRDEYVTLDGARMIGNMIFGDVGKGFNWDLSTGGGGPLTLDAGTNTPTITVSNMTATIGAVLAGTNGLTKTGNGTLTLGGANTFSGGLTINAGTLVGAAPLSPNNHTITVNPGSTLSWTVGSYSGFPMANVGGCTLNIFGGTVSMNAASQNAHNFLMTTVVMQGGTLTSINGVAGPANDGGWGSYNINGYDFGGGGSPSSINVIGPGQSTISSTTLWCNNGGAINVGVTGAGIDLLVLSKITGASTVIKKGPGTMAVTGANDYTAGTTINEGTLLVNNSAGSGTGSGSVTVNAGGTLGGTGAVGGAVTLNGAVAPGGSVGTLATGSETWNGGGAYVFQLSSATNSVGWDRLNITGTLKVQATSSSKFTLKLASMANATTPGLVPDFNSASNYTWTVATASGGILNFDPAKFTVDAGGFSNAYAGSFSVSTNGNALVVKYTAGLTPPTLSAYGPLSGNSFPLTFSGPNGQTYTVLATTNVALPIASWIPLTAGTFDGSPVTYTDTTATNQARFYRIVSP